MKRPRTIQLVRGGLLALVLVLLLVDLAGELGLLTPWVAGRLRRQFAPHGIICRIDTAQMGLVAGIRLHSVTLRDNKDRRVRLLQIKQLRGYPALTALFRGSLRLGSLKAEDLNLYLPPNSRTPAVLPAATIDHAATRIYSDHIRVEKLSGTVLQVPVTLEGIISGLDAMARQSEDRQRPARWSWADANTASGFSLDAPLNTILRQLRSNTFAEEGSGLQGSFELPLDAPETFKIQGRLAVADLFLLNTPMRKLKGRINISAAAIEIPSFALFLNDGSTARGSLQYDRRNRYVSGQIEASLPQSRLRSLAGRAGLPAAQNITSPSPLKLHLSLAPSPPSLDTLRGSLSLRSKQLLCQGTPLGRLAIEGSFEEGVVRLPTVSLARPDQESSTASGSLTIDTTKRRLSGQLDCALPSAQWLEAFEQADALQPWLSFQNKSTPDKIRLQAANSPWPGEGVQLSGSASLASVRLGQLPIASATFDFSLEKSTLNLHNLQVKGEGGLPDQALVTGSLHCDIGERTLGASLRGQIASQQLHPLLRPLFPETIPASIDKKGSVTYELELAPGPLSWQQWSGQASVTGSNLELAGFPLQYFSLPVRFSPTDINSDALSVTLREGLSVRGSVGLNRPNTAVNATLEGTVSSRHLLPFLPEDLASGKLSKLDVDSMNITIRARDIRLKRPGWKLSGALSSGPGSLENFHFQSIQEAEFNLERSALPHSAITFNCRLPRVDIDEHSRLLNTEFSVRASETVSVKMRSQGRAPPEFVQAFLFGPGLQRFYANLWKDFRWDPENPPRVDINSLHFYTNPEEEKWFLRMDADTQIPSVSYRDISARNLSARLILNLPNAVRINKIEAETPPGGTTTGSLWFRLADEPECRLQVKGSLDPNRILSSVVPGWSDTAAVRFSLPCEGSFSGTIPLDVPAKLSLTGTIKTMRGIDVGPLSFENAAGQWQWNDNCLHFESFDADIHDGRFSGSGRYCFVTRKGSLAFDAKNVKLEPLLNSFHGEAILKEDGRVDLTNADIDVYHSGEEQKLGLEGSASLKLRESNLWQIPIFSKLASLLKVSLVRKIVGLGDITSMSAQLKLSGSRVNIHDFRSNGTVISLRGMAPGTFNWRSQALNLAVRGEILKKTVIVPFLTTPISWLFEAELRGTRAQPEWRLLSAVKKGIFGPPAGRDKP